MLAWIKANEDILDRLGAMIAFLWTAGWGVWVWVDAKRRAALPQPHRSQEHESQHIEKEKRQRGAWILMWGLGVLIFAGVWYGVERYIQSLTVTAHYAICRGECRDKCAPHYDWVQCGNVANWATKTCSHSEWRIVSDVSGDHCGYQIADVTCTSNSQSC
jgi:hypothetical protein